MSARSDGNNFQLRQPGVTCVTACASKVPSLTRMSFDRSLAERSLWQAMAGCVYDNRLELFQATIGAAENLVDILFPP